MDFLTLIQVLDSTVRMATPLLLAAHRAHREIGAMLLHCGADPNACRLHDGYAPIHAAAHADDAHAVREPVLAARKLRAVLVQAHRAGI